MDTYDASQEAQFATMLQAGIRMHEVAQRRNGQLVHDHPPPALIVSQFLAARMDLPPDPTDFVVSTTQLPPPYLPSECSVDELQPIHITQMRLGEHHRGTKVMIRILTPPRRINAVLAVAEDLAGTAVILQLYHQPPAAVFLPEEIIQKGSVLMIKEPFFKCSTDGSYSLRVDHLSDIIWLKPFDSRIPDVWRKEFPRMNSEAVRMRGNECVKNRRWAKALHFYSNAVLHAATPEDEQLASVNRALVNLKLNRPEQSLLDATKTKERIAPTEKAAFREFRALYELRLFDRCLERLQQFTANHPDNKEAKSEMKRVKARLNEQLYGAYSFSRMYKQAKASSALIDCATFSEPVEVREAPGRGRGLFTVKAVQAGDLLLCEKAFAYHQCDLSPGRCSILMDLESKRCSAGGQVEILTQIIQNLYHNPEYSRSFLDLHRGDTPDTMSLAQGARLISRVKGTYPASYPASVPRLELFTPCFSVAMEHAERCDAVKSADMLLEGLKALGYEITVVWPLWTRDAAGPLSSQFEIKKWGLADDRVPWALFNLHAVSEFIAPKLSQRILEYTQTAYSMVIGEKETFGTIFPTSWILQRVPAGAKVELV